MRLAFLFLITLVAAAAQVNVLTWHNDQERTGQNLSETILTPSNVNSSSFGKLFVIHVDGKVDAQPLYVSGLSVSGGVHNVLFIVTEHDSVYAADADTGAFLWRRSTLLAGETTSGDHNCDELTPEIGITSTPVIDLDSGPHGTIYLVAMSRHSAGHFYQRLHALDITNGQEEFGGPVDIQATYPGTGEEGSVNGFIHFNPFQHKERAALLLLNGIVYTTWAAICDSLPYTGWVIGYSENSLNQTVVLNLTPNGHRGGIWGAGAGPAAEPEGSFIFLLTGNGLFDSTLDPQGFPSRGDYGNSFLRLSTASGMLSVADYFTMSNTETESSENEDLGSGGAIMLPAIQDTQGHSLLLAVGAGKDRNIYVVNRLNMGKFDPHRDRIYQHIQGVLAGPVFSTPAYFNGTVYYGAVNDPIRAFHVENAKLIASPIKTTEVFPYPGATPSISANGTSNGIVWVAGNAQNASLWAFDATDLSRKLYDSNQAGSRDLFGAGNKFIVPTVANGKVYVGTEGGVGVFGLLPPKP